MKGIVFDSKHRIKKLSIALVSIIALHTLAMMFFEGMSAGDALWLSLTTINTTGYGDLSSETFFGRTFTVILMYGIGITLMAQVATEYIEYRIEQKDRKIKGLWSWNNMNDHIVIINTPNNNPELFLERLIDQIRDTPSLDESPICIVTRDFPDGLPLSIRQMNAAHIHGDGFESADLHKASVETAKFIVVISSDSHARSSDSMTLDVLYHLESLDIEGRVIAEAVKDSNRIRFTELGASSVLRPIRAYPELIVRAMVSPGTEQVLENLFTYEGDHPTRIDHKFSVKQWSDLACHIIKAGLGTPVGYVAEDGKVWTNPPPFKPAIGTALLLLVHEKHLPSEDEVQQLLNRINEE
nr:potassium channel family protein [Pleionea sp. CnH1-48]